MFWAATHSLNTFIYLQNCDDITGYAVEKRQRRGATVISKLRCFSILSLRNAE